MSCEVMVVSDTLLRVSMSRSLSHAGLVLRYLEGNWPVAGSSVG
jgi:hypothetical protein